MATNSNFLLLSITTTFLLHLLSTTTATPVLDIEGAPLESGKPYHILLESSSHGGNPWLSMRPLPRGPNCPKYVLQTPRLTEQGIPVKFIPSNKTLKHIHTSSDLNIVFSKGNECAPRPAWKLTSGANTGRVMVAAEGVSGNSGLRSGFKIEKDDQGGGKYKIVYCPSFAPAGELPVCGDLRLFRDDSGELCPSFGLWWLGLSTGDVDDSSAPLWATFIKA